MCMRTITSSSIIHVIIDALLKPGSALKELRYVLNNNYHYVEHLTSLPATVIEATNVEDFKKRMLKYFCINPATV